jgi:multicomponent Na+:H+ antiporter subunit E
MQQRVLWSVPLALAWMPLTANVSPESFLVGLILGFAVQTVLFSGEEAAGSRPALDRLSASLVYFLILCRDIFLSSMDVARRVTRADMGLNPGILAVPTQYESPALDATFFNPQRDLTAESIAAISAHGITITPGELVVDFEGNCLMYVHCLDVVASSQVVEANQSKRLALLRRILL